MSTHTLHYPHSTFCAALVCCMDGRLTMTNIIWFVRVYWYHGLVDPVANAGGVLDLVRQYEAGKPSLILSDLHISIEKHGVRDIVLQAHRNCGAVPSFEDPEAEYEYHTKLLRHAAEIILQNFGDRWLNIYGQWVEFVPDSAPQKGLFRKLFVFVRRSVRGIVNGLGIHGKLVDFLLPTGSWKIQPLGLLLH